MYGEIIKKDAKKREVFGWAYVAIDEENQVVVDKSGEFVDDPDTLEKAAYKFVHSSRKGGFMHKRSPVSKDDAPVHVSDMIESFVITPEKRQAMGIPDGVVPELAWWVGFKIHDDETWQQVEKGSMFFSIHGKGRKEAIEDGT